jgi:hypothetical protein
MWTRRRKAYARAPLAPGGASGWQSRQHSPHLRRVPLTATGRRDDAASVEGRRKALQARYAGRL